LLDVHGEMAADTARIYTRASSIYEAMLLLLGAYYVADFTYQKVYVNILSILQQFIVGEAYSGERFSSTYFTFLKKHAEKIYKL